MGCVDTEDHGTGQSHKYWVDRPHVSRYIFYSKPAHIPLLRVELHRQNRPLANVVDGRDGRDGRGLGGEGGRELCYPHL